MIGVWQKEFAVKFISLRSLELALREHNFWRFVAAMAVDIKVPVGPNLRLI